jgi:hypothetical protein
VSRETRGDEERKNKEEKCKILNLSTSASGSGREES